MWDALTTQIDVNTIGFYAVTGLFLGTGIGVIGIGTQALMGYFSAQTIIGAASTAACGDGDCLNEVVAVEESVQNGITVLRQSVESSQPAVNEVSNLLLRYIHPNDILPNGDVMSRAFKDSTMSVFNEGLGATPELVFKTQSTAAGVPGQGGVVGLNPNELSNINGVQKIVNTIGDTGNAILDAAHQEVLNSGTRSVAKHIRDIAKWLLP